jgi:hypothetical protein
VSASDPLLTMWDALAAHDCEPHGRPHDFRARCPLHDGDNPEALHVSVGGDGSALIHCFAHHCPAEEIAAAIGVDVRDLFPPGHHRARRRQLSDARRADFVGRARTVGNVLLALERLGADWYLELRCDCPHCGSAAALLQVSNRGVQQLSCPGDEDADRLGYTACTLDQFEQALAGRVEDLDPREENAA